MNGYANNNVNTNAADMNNTNAKNGNGANTATFIGCRIAGAPTYTPAHMREGAAKPMVAQCTFNVFQNIRGKRLVFNMTAWGKMADSIARGGATGKEVTIIGSANSYEGRVWLPSVNGQPSQFVTKSDGTPLTITKIGFTIEKLSWGADSAKTIQEEITAGQRPQGWNDPTQPGYVAWREECARRNAAQYVPGSEWFGYARVRQPNGQIVTNTVAQGAAGQAMQYQGNPEAVANTMGQQNGYNQAPVQPQYQAQPQAQAQPPVAGYQAAPTAGQPVIVQGQHMGYAPAQPPAQPAGQGGYPAQPATAGGYGAPQQTPGVVM